MAAEDSLSAPFLATRPDTDHQLKVVLDVNGFDNTVLTESVRLNPFEFIGAHEGFEVPGYSTVDPFRNGTPGVECVYEWLKIVICLPVAAVRLVLFGLCLTVGYIATVLALDGWKDKQNPLPKWRCRVMWVTRLCARAILFSLVWKLRMRVWSIKMLNWKVQKMQKYRSYSAPALENIPHPRSHTSSCTAPAMTSIPHPRFLQDRTGKSIFWCAAHGSPRFDCAANWGLSGTIKYIIYLPSRVLGSQGKSGGCC